MVLNPPSNLLTLHKGQQKSKDSDKPTQTQKRIEKSFQTTHSLTFFRSFSLSLTLLLFLYFLSPHPSPLLGIMRLRDGHIELASNLLSQSVCIVEKSAVIVVGVVDGFEGKPEDNRAGGDSGSGSRIDHGNT